MSAPTKDDDKKTIVKEFRKIMDKYLKASTGADKKTELDKLIKYLETFDKADEFLKKVKWTTLPITVDNNQTNYKLTPDSPDEGKKLKAELNNKLAEILKNANKDQKKQPNPLDNEMRSVYMLQSVSKHIAKMKDDKHKDKHIGFIKAVIEKARATEDPNKVKATDSFVFGSEVVSAINKLVNVSTNILVYNHVSVIFDDVQANVLEPLRKLKIFLEGNNKNIVQFYTNIVKIKQYLGNLNYSKDGKDKNAQYLKKVDNEIDAIIKIIADNIQFLVVQPALENPRSIDYELMKIPDKLKRTSQRIVDSCKKHMDKIEKISDWILKNLVDEFDVDVSTKLSQLIDDFSTTVQAHLSYNTVYSIKVHDVMKTFIQTTGPKFLRGGAGSNNNIKDDFKDKLERSYYMKEHFVHLFDKDKDHLDFASGTQKFLDDFVKERMTASLYNDNSKADILAATLAFHVMKQIFGPMDLLASPENISYSFKNFNDKKDHVKYVCEMSMRQILCKARFYCNEFKGDRNVKDFVAGADSIVRSMTRIGMATKEDTAVIEVASSLCGLRVRHKKFENDDFETIFKYLTESVQPSSAPSFFTPASLPTTGFEKLKDERKKLRLSDWAFIDGLVENQESSQSAAAGLVYNLPNLLFLKAFNAQKDTYLRMERVPPLWETKGAENQTFLGALPALDLALNMVKISNPSNLFLDCVYKFCGLYRQPSVTNLTWSPPPISNDFVKLPSNTESHYNFTAKTPPNKTTTILVPRDFHLDKNSLSCLLALNSTFDAAAMISYLYVNLQNHKASTGTVVGSMNINLTNIEKNIQANASYANSVKPIIKTEEAVKDEFQLQMIQGLDPIRFTSKSGPGLPSTTDSDKINTAIYQIRMDALLGKSGNSNLPIPVGDQLQDLAGGLNNMAEIKGLTTLASLSNLHTNFLDASHFINSNVNVTNMSALSQLTKLSTISTLSTLSTLSEIGDKTTLTSLNHLKGLADLTNLKILNNNNLRTTLKELLNLKYLNELSSLNSLTLLPNDVQQLSDLNNTTNINSITQTISLTTKLSSLNNLINLCSNINTLSGLTSLTRLSTTTGLTFDYGGHTNVRDLNCLTGLTALTILSHLNGLRRMGGLSNLYKLNRLIEPLIEVKNIKFISNNTKDKIQLALEPSVDKFNTVQNQLKVTKLKIDDATDFLSSDFIFSSMRFLHIFLSNIYQNGQSLNPVEEFVNKEAQHLILKGRATTNNAVINEFLKLFDNFCFDFDIDHIHRTFIAFLRRADAVNKLLDYYSTSVFTIDAFSPTVQDITNLSVYDYIDAFAFAKNVQLTPSPGTSSSGSPRTSSSGTPGTSSSGSPGTSSSGSPSGSPPGGVLPAAVAHSLVPPGALIPGAPTHTVAPPSSARDDIADGSLLAPPSSARDDLADGSLLAPPSSARDDIADGSLLAPPPPGSRLDALDSLMMIGGSDVEHLSRLVKLEERGGCMGQVFDAQGTRNALKKLMDAMEKENKDFLDKYASFSSGNSVLLGGADDPSVLPKVAAPTNDKNKPHLEILKRNDLDDRLTSRRIQQIMTTVFYNVISDIRSKATFQTCINEVTMYDYKKLDQALEAVLMEQDLVEAVKSSSTGKFIKQFRNLRMKSLESTKGRLITRDNDPRARILQEENLETDHADLKFYIALHLSNSTDLHHIDALWINLIDYAQSYYDRYTLDKKIPVLSKYMYWKAVAVQLSRRDDVIDIFTFAADRYQKLFTDPKYSQQDIFGKTRAISAPTQSFAELFHKIASEKNVYDLTFVLSVSAKFVVEDLNTAIGRIQSLADAVDGGGGIEELERKESSALQDVQTKLLDGIKQKYDTLQKNVESNKSEYAQPSVTTPSNDFDSYFDAYYKYYLNANLTQAGEKKYERQSADLTTMQWKEKTESMMSKAVGDWFPIKTHVSILTPIEVDFNEGALGSNFIPLTSSSSSLSSSAVAASPGISVGTSGLVPQIGKMIGFAGSSLGSINQTQVSTKSPFDRNDRVISEGTRLAKLQLAKEALVARDVMQDIRRENRRLMHEYGGSAEQFKHSLFGGMVISNGDSERSEQAAVRLKYMYDRLAKAAHRYLDFHVAAVERCLHKYMFYGRRAWDGIPPPGVWSEFVEAVDQLESRGSAFFGTFVAEMERTRQTQEGKALFDNIYDDIEEDPDAMAEVELVSLKTMEEILDNSEKVVRLYRNARVHMISFVVDKKFAIFYAIKLARIGISYIALSLSSKLFEDTYMVKVYTQNAEPPSLLTMLGYFLGFDIAINFVLTLVLAGYIYIFAQASDPGLLDWDFLIRSLIDYAIFMIILVIMAVIVGSIMMQKKFFRYQIEGARAIRAYMLIIFYVSIVIQAMPFFVLV